MPSKSPCDHIHLSFGPSTAAATKQKVRTRRQLAIAAQLEDSDDYPPESTFPYPLLLPDDDLVLDPNQPPQSLLSWQNERNRNQFIPKRRKLYILQPPEIPDNVSHMRSWHNPILPHSSSTSGKTTPLPGPNLPEIGHIAGYLSAFFEPLQVERLQDVQLEFAPWTTRRRKSPLEIGLSTGTHCTKIRFRRSPDKLFTAQLNLNDLTDVLLDVLPEDAYALLMIVNQDMYEDENDDFCCGRAFGASRVAVVSTARYNPVLDKTMGVGRRHSWPASHCSQYIEGISGGNALAPQGDQSSHHLGKRKRQSVSKSSLAVTSSEVGSMSIKPIDLTSSPLRHSIGIESASKTATPTYTSPLRAALNASSVGKALRTSNDEELLYLSRVVKTICHELGHCLGIDHCVYHACIMQSSASLAEDARQPPYLCPVDLRKLASAVGEAEGWAAPTAKEGKKELEVERQQREKEWVRKHYSALRDVCVKLSTDPQNDISTDRKSTGDSSRRPGKERQLGPGGRMFAAFAAWCEWMLAG